MSYTNTGDFHKVNKRRHHTSSRNSFPVAASLIWDASAKARRNNSNRATVIGIRLMGNILEELGWEPLSYIQVYEGTGDNVGKILLTPSNDPTTAYKLSYGTDAGTQIMANGRLANGHLPSCALKFGIGGLEFHVIDPNVSDRDRRITTCRYNVFRGELLVTLPAWFQPTKAAQRRRITHSDTAIDDSAQDAQPRVKRAYNKRNSGATT
jgi:hypothetical protein